MEDIGNRRRGRGEVRGAKQRGNREIPGLSEARDAPGNPYTGRAASSDKRRGGNRGGGRHRGGDPQDRGEDRRQQASQAQARSPNVNSATAVTDHIADRVVAQNPISTAATSKGVITPTVEYLPTHTTSRVVIP